MSASPRHLPTVLALALAAVTACTARPGPAPSSTAVPSAAAPSAAVPSAATPSAAVPSGAVPTDPTEPGPPASCGEAATWSTASKAVGSPGSPAAVFAVRAGQHPAECYDRINLDLNGPDPVGYFAGYVPADRVVTEGDGAPLTVPGTAFLRVVVIAPILGRDAQGHQPWRAPPRPGDALLDPAQVRGWPTVTAVVYAGGHPNETVVIIGLRARVAFDVDATWVNPRTQTRVVSLDLRRP
jgi:hypothetical protein